MSMGKFVAGFALFTLPMAALAQDGDAPARACLLYTSPSPRD